MPSGASKAVIIVEIISALFGFVGGMPLLIDLSGRILELETNLIACLPIKNFVLPSMVIIVNSTNKHNLAMVDSTNQRTNSTF